MMEQSHIEVSLSKKKLILTLLGSLMFVAIGLWMVIARPSSNHFFFSNPALVLGAGVAGILFFGFVAVKVIPKLMDKKPGLIINSNGITDNSSGVSAGFIPWADIEDIRLAQVFNQRFLLIMVNNPEQYINRASNAITRKLITSNYSSYGSPISISSHALQMDFDQLHALLVEKMKTFK